LEGLAYIVSKNALKLSSFASLTTGVLYVLSARFAGFIEAGHFGLIASMAWIPFVLLATIKLSCKTKMKWSILLSFSFAGIFYTHPTTFVYSAILSSFTFAIFLVSTQKPNGRAVIAMDSGNLLFRVVWLFWESTKGKVWKSAHLHPFHHTELESVVKKSGFKIIKKQFSHFYMEVSFLLRK